jgi:chromate reductase, NAD(P)H dehydrogenase (quinone)
MVIFSISGSLRSSSANTAILQTMKSVTPAGNEFIIYNQLGELPHFNPDLDIEGRIPASVKELRGMIKRSHAIIISTPEYAHGIPGSLKNALDWLVSTNVLENKPTAILLGSTSEGNFAKDSLVETLKTMNANVIPDLVTSMAGIQAEVDDPGTWQKLKDFVENLTLNTKPKS